MNVRPGGTLPQPVKTAAGEPVVLTVKLNAEPSPRPWSLAALVKAGAWPTTIVKGSLASGLIPLPAPIVMFVVPVAVAVPARVAVPSPLSVNVSPAGSVPVSVIAGVGDPVAVIATDPAWFRVKSAAGRLSAGGARAAFTVMVSASVAVLPEALVAEIDTG